MDTLLEIARLFPQNFLTGLLMYGILLTLVYVLVWRVFAQRFQTRRIQQPARADAAQIRAELQNAFLSLLVSATTSTILIYCSTKGYTQLYTDISEHSTAWAVGSLFLMWAIDDAWFYWVHRFLHHPKLYPYVHEIHHRSIDVTPFSSLSFHVLEALGLTLWIIPFVFLVPTYAPVLGILQVIGFVNNVKSHLGYEFFPRFTNRSPLRVLVSSTHHNMHHSQFNGNYGLHFRFWDWLCGTEFPEYESTFERIHQRHPESASAQRDASAETIAAQGTIQYKGTHSFQVRAGETVLQALQRQQIAVPYSCQQGICGTCKCQLTRGAVAMGKPRALSPIEIQRGYILTCQSIPTTDEIELRLD